jgi:hypothetical protein
MGLYLGPKSFALSMKYLIAAILIASSFTVFSQSNYQKATIVTNNNETVAGYINSREWKENPQYIEFKNEQTDKTARKIYPSAIKSFSIDGFDKYYAYLVKISLNHVVLSDLVIGADSSSKTGIVFLKQVSVGRDVNLYTYTDSLKTRYFVQERQATPYELLFQQFYDNTKTSVLKENTYISQLTNLVHTYAPTNLKLANSVTRADYYGDIENIINDINGGVVAVKNKTSYTRYFVGASLNIAQTAIDGRTDFNNNPVTTTTPRVSAGIDIFGNPRVQKIVLRAELAYSYINPQFIGHIYINASQQSDEYYNFTQSNFTFTPQIIWNVYNKPALKFYVLAGLGFNYSTYSNEHFTIRGTLGAGDYAAFPLEQFWANFPVQIGTVINKKVELFASYTYTSSYTKAYDGFSMNSNLYNIGIHYLFARTEK